jgi:glycerophosphoryl diester phosphodiesterase
MLTLPRPFRILAHRGASGYAPENTIAAFDLAVRMRSEAIETDLRLTRDGVIVVFHDETMDRMTTGSGKVADFTYAELAELVIDGEHADKYPPQRVLRVEELLDRYFGQIPLCLEIKAHGVIEPLVALLKRRGDLAGKVEFTSCETTAAGAIKAHLLGAKVGRLVWRNYSPEIIRQVHAAGFAEVCPAARETTAVNVALAHELGLSIRTHGIKSLDDLRHVITAGADGTTLNWPDWIRRPDRRSTAAIAAS